VASLSQGRTAAAQCGLFTHKSVPVIFEPPCILVFALTSVPSATLLAKYLALRLSAGTLVFYTALRPFFLSYCLSPQSLLFQLSEIIPYLVQQCNFFYAFFWGGGASFKYFLSSSCLINSNHMPQSLQTLIYQIRCFITGGAKAT